MSDVKYYRGPTEIRTALREIDETFYSHYLSGIPKSSIRDKDVLEVYPDNDIQLRRWRLNLRLTWIQTYRNIKPGGESIVITGDAINDAILSFICGFGTDVLLKHLVHSRAFVKEDCFTVHYLNRDIRPTWKLETADGEVLMCPPKMESV
ncbi:hypothetical protein FDI21_gp223 [Pseudomonas phage Noxifer]|uniref:Uncharacterized protein n=1 Tax=Pseudomonas phage Noxifer TaxID=2006684 RepID=A0A1Y0T1Q7_9CAUD|nr:hypothetical protein FDI21_gp223 [Pseudomonas phage Noxifer]ARV77488.1 hypothetical protein NOXIFER_323 [Pseudomonas phage Noxifer]